MTVERISTLRRWLRFNAVGILGLAVQLAVLALLSGAGCHYLAATLLAVEAAILHNFAWHLIWTWSDRPAGSPAGVLRWLLEFHLANGVVSLTGNLALMRLLVGVAGLPVLPANLVSVALLSLVNFLLGHHWVFRPAAHQSIDCRSRRN